MNLLFALLFTSFFVSISQAADQSDVNFLTAFVGDFKDHRGEYILYLATATNVPPEVTSLALEIATYTDDSYTTILDDPEIDISSLEAFATNLPWYTRIEAEANEGNSNQNNEVEISLHSGENVTITTTDESVSTTLSSSSTTPAISDTTSVNGGISRTYAPVGALLGVLFLGLGLL
ncbi:Seripauperin and TIP1 family-domain-containing protein [Scheffersomyces amazonensis]|uniref:Seripauperin and TIP1 family-domain-containing protein n=1 Tax=Scheffersomyces amazonensis TaxID=1078765 RepID=UPI00315DD75E